MSIYKHYNSCNYYYYFIYFRVFYYNYITCASENPPIITAKMEIKILPGSKISPLLNRSPPNHQPNALIPNRTKNRRPEPKPSNKPYTYPNLVGLATAFLN